MKIRIAQEQARVPVSVFYLDGSIHLGNAEQLEQAARTAANDGAQNMVIDLTNVPSMTSAGLRVLHIIYKLLGTGGNHEPRAAASGEPSSSVGKSAHLKLANPSPALRRVIEIAGFDTFLEIHGDVPEAVASF